MHKLKFQIYLLSLKYTSQCFSGPFVTTCNEDHHRIWGKRAKRIFQELLLGYFIKTPKIKFEYAKQISYDTEFPKTLIFGQTWPFIIEKGHGAKSKNVTSVTLGRQVLQFTKSYAHMLRSGSNVRMDEGRYERTKKNTIFIMILTKISLRT